MMTTQEGALPPLRGFLPEGLEAKDFEGICPRLHAFLAGTKDYDSD